MFIMTINNNKNNNKKQTKIKHKKMIEESAYYLLPGDNLVEFSPSLLPGSF